MKKVLIWLMMRDLNVYISAYKVDNNKYNER